MAETPLGRLAGRTGQAAAGLAAYRAAWPAAAVAIVLLGGFLRFSGIGWDIPDGSTIPLQMHPDERFISIVNEKIDWPSSPAAYFDTANSPLNPYNQPETPSFVYGTFPIFAAKAVASTAGADVPVISPLASLACDADGYDWTVVCGRRLTAAVDTLTIVLVMALAGLLAGRAVGLLAGLLYALSVLPVQLSHFWAVDPWVVFFGVATVLLCLLWVAEPPAASRLRTGRGGRRDDVVALLRRPETRSAALVAGIGICVGLGLASKVTAWPLVLGPALATAFRIGMRDLPGLRLTFRGTRPPMPGHWSYDLVAIMATLLLALVVFRIAQPYAFTGPHFWDMAINPQWRADIEREIDFQNGNVDFPPFVHFAGRTPFAWPLLNMALWGLGPALALAAWSGLIASAVLAVRRRDVAWVLPAVMVAAVVGFQGPRFVAYMRYFAPAYPFLAIFAALAVSWLFRFGRGQPAEAAGAWARLSSALMPRASRRQQATRAVALAAAVAVPALTSWWAMAYTAVLRADHPRIAASEWMYENIPEGAAITTEIWDDSLPYSLGGLGPGRYELINLFPFETDSVSKVATLVYGTNREGNPSAGLVGADYVILSSDRVRTAVSRLEREYPAMIRYYELLESGELGFDLVARFASRPTFLGISIDDSEAEESFTVYDHPEVRIYQKSVDFDADRAFALLMEAHPERAVNLLPRQGKTNGLQFTADAFARVQGSGTFSDVFSDSTVFSRAPAAWWFAWVQAMALASVPAVTWLFRRLPDRGYGLSKVIGFAGSGLLTWMLVAWGVTTFSAALAWGVAAAIVAGGIALGVLRRETLAIELRTRWPLWLASEAVFAAVFAFFLAIRMEIPDLWHNYQGGEKPVELAFLTAIARSATMPPYDPWFSGGTMNYYYMGWFLVAVPMRAMRILPEVGFNLAIPTYAALAAVTAFSTAANLAGAGGRLATRIRLRPAVAAGILGALLLVGIGNLDAGHQAIERFQQLNFAGFDPTGQPVYHWSLFSGTPFLGGAVGLASGVYRWLFADGMLPPFDWWRPSRVHYPAFDITEFPYFSFLFGDLHAHLMGIPFFGLVIALCLAYVLTVDRDGVRGWCLAALMGVGLGLVRTIHTWDFPTAVLLTLAAIAGGQLLRRDRVAVRCWDGLGHATVAIAVLFVAFSPYMRHNEVFETGLVRARETTAANQYFAHFGLFVAITVIFLAVRYFEELRERDWLPGRNPVFAVVAGRWEVFSLATFVVGLTAFTWRWGLATVALSVLLLLFLGNLAWAETRRRDRNVPRLFATVTLAAAIGIAGGVDVIQVGYDIVRMNTVFKFSLQAWQLYALGGAYALWYSAVALSAVEIPRARMPGRRIAGGLALAVVTVLLFGSVLYPWSGTRARLQARFEGSPSGTLDGLAYLPYGYFTEGRGTDDHTDDVLILLGDDEPLIRWLRENIEGTPVIAEAVGPLYHWTSRISWNTGLPTVVGWDWHEVAYRTDYEHLVQRRRIDTSIFYTDGTTEAAREYLRRYDVSYVVVGTTEHVLGTPEGIARFDRMPELNVVFSSGDYRIYEVDRAMLGTATLFGPPP